MGVGLVECQLVAERLLGQRMVNQAGRDDNADDAWSQRNRNRRAPRSSAGYGGADRPRPKPAHTAAALQRNLIREEWIEGFIADHPKPAHPEFWVPGSWERWVRGVFITYRKMGRQVQGEDETGQHHHGGPLRHPRLRQQGRPPSGHGPEHGPPRSAEAAGAQQARRRRQGRASGEGATRAPPLPEGPASSSTGR